MRPIQYWRHGNAFHEIVFRLYVRPPEIERIATVRHLWSAKIRFAFTNSGLNERSSGMCRSKRITSGFKAAVIEIASAKLLASPSSFIAGSSSRKFLSVLRITSASSTTSTLTCWVRIGTDNLSFMAEVDHLGEIVYVQCCTLISYVGQATEHRAGDPDYSVEPRTTSVPLGLRRRWRCPGSR
jgi:hypothetical protein